MKSLPELTVGSQVGGFTILRDSETRGNQRAYWCRCRCGRESYKGASHLHSGYIRGCIKCRPANHRTHGHSRAQVEYRIWATMKDRCERAKSTAFKDYGGRGITVCERWRNSYENFFADMGPRPTDEHMIERKDNNGPYSPENCIWAGWDQQANNRRNNRHLTLNGVTKTMRQWSRITGINYYVLASRVGKLRWSHEQALTTPVKPRWPSHLAHHPKE